MAGASGSASLRLRVTLLLFVLVALGWSSVAPYDRLTWWLEVAPVLIGLPLLLLTGRRFPLTPLLYVLLALHAIILIVGGHYTYARVPIGAWVAESFDLGRNHYDRLGHLAQGFVPAIPVRELLRRSSPLTPRGWLPVLTVCACLAFSAFYEMLEWWAALLAGDSAGAFLGTQGDVWDTQWDMFLALVGATLAVLLLTRLHERQLERLGFSA